MSRIINKCINLIGRYKKNDPNIIYFNVYSPKLETQYRRPIYFVRYNIPCPSYVGNDPDDDVIDDAKYSRIKHEEIEMVKNVASIARKTMKYVIDNIGIGMTGSDVDCMIFKKITEQNAYPSLFKYRKYARSSFICPNNIANHGMPEYCNLKKGDIVTIDFAVYYQGFHIDIAETILLGDVDQIAQDLCDTAKKLTYSIIGICKPGFNLNGISKIVRNTLEGTRFSIIKEFCGHGIGKSLYQGPLIYYDGTLMNWIMQPGMMFTIEPIITEGKPMVELWPNAVTYSTSDNFRTAKYERTILITNNGCEILTD